MKRQIQLHEQTLDRIQADTQRNQQAFSDMIERAQGQIREMEETLSRATLLLARNSADFGAELEEAKSELAVVRGFRAEMTHELEQLNRRLEEMQKNIVGFALAAGLDLPVDESRIPGDARSFLAMIKDSMATGRYGEVRSLARVYQERYPNAGDLDAVHMLMAESHIQQKQYARALGALRRFVDMFPKSPRMPDALYEMANSFFMLGDCTDARILISAIEARHATSSAAQKAARLKALMDSQPGRCTS